MVRSQFGHKHVVTGAYFCFDIIIAFAKASLEKVQTH
jgi:hypothetical protein